MIKRIILLGNTGFIGRHLEKALRRSMPETEILGQSLPALDLTRLEDVRKLANVFGLDTAVIMCAAKKRQFADNLEAFEQNVQMTINLCRILEKTPVKRFIFFSSSAVYGEDIHNTRITEETRVSPTSYYGMAKYAAERLYAKTIGNQKESSLVILRPPLIYGPGDSGKTYGPSGFVQAALNSEPIALWGDGTESREFMFVEDIVEIVRRFLNNSYEGVVNVASGKSHTFRDVLDVISRIVSQDLPLTSRPRTKEKVDNAFDNMRLRKVLGDFRFTTLEEGIRKTFEAERNVRGKYLSTEGIAHR